MEKITAIKIVLFIIGSLFVLIALYLFTRKKEADKAPGWIIAAIIVFTLQSSWDWFVTTGIEFMSEYIPEFIHEIFFEEDPVAEGASQTQHSHIVADTKKENIQEPDCTSGGSYEQIEICECGEVINHKTYEVETLGHNYNTTNIPAINTNSIYVGMTCCRYRVICEFISTSFADMHHVTILSTGCRDIRSVVIAGERILTTKSSIREVTS